MLSVLLAACLLPQGPTPEEFAPSGLTIVCVDVDQGDATVIQAPDGTVHVVDAGADGFGTARVLPVVQGLLARPGARRGHTFASHYHVDHIGGLDEVRRSSSQWRTAYDRGDQRRPTNTFVQSYLASASGRRRTVLVGGSPIQLGGGATATVVAANGIVQGGASVSFTGFAQEENGRSVALRIDYGDFSMWIGGDLTGGGNGTADVETPASLACGDVDVYRVDHHGSRTSTNSTLVFALDPELCVFSCGKLNPFGHPKPEVINRLNPPNASRVLLSMTEGANECSGAPCAGFAATGTVTIATDGTRYRATAANGEFLDFFVDEDPLRAPSAQDVRISELHRDPQRVADDKGEYIELTNVAGTPISLDGVRVVSQSGTFTFRASVALFPGRPVLLQHDGLRSRNGGMPLGIVWLFGSISLANTSDTLQLVGATVLDRLSWSAGFPGGRGVAAERIDLLGASSAANFAPAGTAYGIGERGTPGTRNSVDATVFPSLMRVESAPGLIVLRASALSCGNRFSVIGMAFTSAPGFSFGGQQIPLNIDPLLLATLPLPGFIGLLPPEGYRSLPLTFPARRPPGLFTAFAAHIVLGAKVSAARGFFIFQ